MSLPFKKSAEVTAMVKTLGEASGRKGCVRLVDRWSVQRASFPLAQ